MTMIRKIFLTALFATLLSFCGLQAEQVGIGWEFNSDGNVEGWSTTPAFSNLAVAGGVLQANVVGDFPCFVSPEFSLAAAEYGFIVLRMKAPGATAAIFYWDSDPVTYGFIRVDVAGDSSFHDYAVPVFQRRTWIGSIRKFNSIMVNAPKGANVEIDYLRIVKLGFKPTVLSFSPLRTVIKKDQEIPVYAVIANTGDHVGTVSIDLHLAEPCQILSGNERLALKDRSPGSIDTLQWKVRCPANSDYAMTLSLTVNDTLFSSMNLPVHVTDTFWQQQEFFLSAWSPPGLTTAAYDYYSQANFDLVLSLPTSESATGLVEQYHMHGLLNAGSVLDENRYLRAPENKIPETIPDAQLAKLDPIISRNSSRNAVIGYYLTDEPNAKAFANLGKTVAYIRQKDPTRLSYINLFPTYADASQLGNKSYEEHVQQFIETVKPELLSYDHYHFFKTYDGTEYFKNLGIIRKYALRYDIPFCNIIQAIGADFLDWRIPSAAEHRWLVYSSLAYGAKAIVWFHWDHEWGLTGSLKRDELYASITALNKEIRTLGPVLLKLKSEAVYHSRQVPSGGTALPPGTAIQSVSANADLVLGFFKDENQQPLVMLMNKSYKDSVAARITLAGDVKSVQQFDVAANSWKPVVLSSSESGSLFSAAFQPGAGFLYRLSHTTDVSPRPVSPPASIGLLRNYPNPFNSSTTIEYELIRSAPTKITIFDSLGRQVAVLLDKQQVVGTHRLIWDGQGVASGTYLIRMTAGADEQIRKLVLIK
jgi:hypothetical protein